MIPSYWTNWAKTQSCFTTVRKPRTREALLDAVHRALASGPVRVAGASASWSPLVPTHGTIIDVSRLDRILDFRPAPTNTVTVEPGVTIEQLTEYLAKRGYSLKCPTLFPKPTIGGAIATGSHGTGTWWGPLSDWVRSIELVDGRGQLRRIDATTPAALAAARVSLGTFGVMTAIELEIEPDFHLDVYVRRLSVKETMADLPGLLASHEYVFLMGMPFEGTLWARLGNRSAAPTDPHTVGERLVERTDAALERVMARYMLPYIAKQLPTLTPTILSIANATATQADHDVEIASREMHHQKAYPRAVTMSFSVPIAEAATAWLETDSIVRWYRARGMYPVNMAYVARFIGASHSYLSPAYGRPSCFFEVTTAVETPDQDDFFRDAWNMFLAIPGARPHWGKRWERPFPLAGLYPELATFRAQQQLFDPNRTFVNDWLADLGI